jgi:1-deoxy-D-xylulose-5-phosphate synthase
VARPNAVIEKDLEPMEIGKGVCVARAASRVAGIWRATGRSPASGGKIDATVVDMRFVKPMDEALVREMAGSHELLVTVEENAIMGGAGAAVSEFLARKTCSSRCCTWACRTFMWSTPSPPDAG